MTKVKNYPEKWGKYKATKAVQVKAYRDRKSQSISLGELEAKREYEREKERTAG